MQLVQLNELRPDYSTANQDQTYFMLVFRPDPTSPDTPAPLHIIEQLRDIVLSDWLHFSAADIQSHRSNNTTTTRPCEYRKPERRLILTRPISSPWIPYLDLYLPACNAIADRSLGILTGLPITIPPLNTNQRLHFHLLDHLFHLFDPFLPDILKDPFLRRNLLGIRSGKFTIPGQSKPQYVAYISATSQQVFNLFFNAQQKYLDSLNKLCINLYGFQVRIVSMPNPKKREDQPIRARIHSTASMLHNNLQRSIQLRIPIDYFSSPITDQVIQRVLNTKLVIAFLPVFHDQTKPTITHYVLYVFRNHQTCQLDNIKKIERTLPDFPKNLLIIPAVDPNSAVISDSNSHSTLPHGNRKTELDAFDIMIQSPAFYNKTSATSAWDLDDKIPSHISTSKRSHHSSGDTQHKPPRQKSRNHGDHTSDSTTAHSSESPSVNTDFCEHQTEHMDEDIQDDSQTDELIPDSQYAFCLDHSQATRLEVRDALGIARSISDKRFQETYLFLARHGNAPFDLTLLKSIASRPASLARSIGSVFHHPWSDRPRNYRNCCIV
jgi:hypothetical protein